MRQAVNNLLAIPPSLLLRVLHVIELTVFINIVFNSTSANCNRMLFTCMSSTSLLDLEDIENAIKIIARKCLHESRDARHDLNYY